MIRLKETRSIGCDSYTAQARTLDLEEIEIVSNYESVILEKFVLSGWQKKV